MGCQGHYIKYVYNENPVEFPLPGYSLFSRLIYFDNFVFPVIVYTGKKATSLATTLLLSTNERKRGSQ